MKHTLTLVAALLMAPLAISQAASAADTSPADWPSYNHDVAGWRFNPDEKTISAANASRLVEKWCFPGTGSKETIGVVHATPSVVAGEVYFGTATFPAFYKLAPAGTVRWVYRNPARKTVLPADAAIPLTEHLRSSSDLGELRDILAEWNDGVLKLSATKAEQYAWAVIPAPQSGWKLARRDTVNAEITNTGDTPAGVMLWIVGDHGWDAVLDTATLAPHETRTFSCNLRAAFPDRTPKLNPVDVKQVQIMLAEPVNRPAKPGEKSQAQSYLSPRITKTVSLEVRQITAQGDASEWKRPAGRLDVPIVENTAPAPGKRVRYQLAGDEKTLIYSVLNLPEDWQKGKKYPVIVEYPGNFFYAPACYSTGMPEQCVIGYGMTKGKGAICLGMPFVDRSTGKIAENGWGNADDTADYVMRMVAEVCAKFGGDRENIVLTGFSRGAIACGYIGLRDDRIAALWKGFHACQHYDGANWNGSTMPGAIERAARFQGKAVFQTDNSQDKFQPVMDVMKTRVTWAQSGLGFHSTAMFLDDRQSSQQLREWFWQLVGNPHK